MSSSSTGTPSKVFLTGATGYIGGSILSSLLKHPNKYTVSALVRQKEQGEVLKQHGVTPVYGTLDDSEVLFEAARASDAVVHTADADHLPSAQALVRGLSAKKDKQHAVYLHTSGTGVLTYDGVIEEPFDDLDIARVHNIPLRALHKEIDAWIFDNCADITTAIIAPSTINGIGTGFFKKTSQQVINLAKASVARGKAGYVGERKDVRWNNVNIHDLADLYLLVLDGLLAGTADSGKEGGWYFGVTHEHTWYHVAELLASSLRSQGLIETTEISPFEQQYLEKYLGGQFAHFAFGSDSRAVANRSRKLGWTPTRPNAYETLAEELKYLIETGELKTQN